MESPKCPRCGFVACEQFDTVYVEDKRTPHFRRQYMQPNGKYKCYRCDIDVAAEPAQTEGK